MQVRPELQLVPITKYRNEMSILDQPGSPMGLIDKDGKFQLDDGETYTLCVMEESDIPDTARFVIEAFGADAISLSQDLNSLERAVLEPSIGLVNAYSGLVAYAEVFAGTQSRSKDRKADISAPELTGETREEKLQQAERSSLILVLAKPKPDHDWHIDVIASIELRLQPTDAKIPFSLPLLDRLERRLAASKPTGDLQPYLSNLCVADSCRRKSVGKALVRCVEDIAQVTWGYKKMFLHVDFENEAARKLYEEEGYTDVGKRWRPFWAGKAAEIGYFLKKL